MIGLILGYAVGRKVEHDASSNAPRRGYQELPHPPKRTPAQVTAEQRERRRAGQRRAEHRRKLYEAVYTDPPQAPFKMFIGTVSLPPIDADAWIADYYGGPVRPIVSLDGKLYQPPPPPPAQPYRYLPRGLTGYCADEWYAERERSQAALDAWLAEFGRRPVKVRKERLHDEATQNHEMVSGNEPGRQTTADDPGP